MLIGVPKEIKSDEYRVAMIPAEVEFLTHQGHRVVVQAQAGMGSGIEDSQYREAGGEIVPAAENVWRRKTGAWCAGSVSAFFPPSEER